MTSREGLKQELEKKHTLFDITQHLIEYIDVEHSYLADLFICRAYQLGLEAGLSAKEEFNKKENTK